MSFLRARVWVTKESDLRIVSCSAFQSCFSYVVSPPPSYEATSTPSVETRTQIGRRFDRSEYDAITLVHL